MTQKILALVIIFVVCFLGASQVLADVVEPGRVCRIGVDTCNTSSGCPTCDCVGVSSGSSNGQCQPAGTGAAAPGGPAGIFGKVVPPSPLAGFVSGDKTGALGISQFLSNLVSLIYVLATVVLIFMLIWGAFDWITSEGNKEKIAAARGKLINAVIGIMLFAVAFAIIQVLGRFTGFTFFEGQR